MTSAVAAAAAIANRATLDARQRIAQLKARCELRMQQEIAQVTVAEFGKWIESEVLNELASAFTAGYCARDEESAVGRLPGPRRKR